jgi:hypothetical protein
VDLAHLAFGPGKTRPASWQLLILERVHRFAVEALGIAVDDLDIAAVALIALEASQIGACCPFQQSRAILVHAVQLAEEFRRECDGGLDSHKTNIPQIVLTMVCIQPRRRMGKDFKNWVRAAAVSH